jgi:hypothetical protein
VLAHDKSCAIPSYSHHPQITPLLPIRQHKPTACNYPLDAGLPAVRLGSDSTEKGSATPRSAAGQPPLLSPLTSQARRWRHCHVGRCEITLDALGVASDGVAPPLRYEAGGGGAVPPVRCRGVGTPLSTGVVSANRLPPAWLLTVWARCSAKGCGLDDLTPRPVDAAPPSVSVPGDCALTLAGQSASTGCRSFPEFIAAHARHPPPGRPQGKRVAPRVREPLTPALHGGRLHIRGDELRKDGHLSSPALQTDR